MTEVKSFKKVKKTRMLKSSETIGCCNQLTLKVIYHLNLILILFRTNQSAARYKENPKKIHRMITQLAILKNRNLAIKVQTIPFLSSKMQ